ncbi:MAG: serine protease [Verrucomicrobiales bacterium]|nr:serine protease [Verrucomicrobiales bacterium]
MLFLSQTAKSADDFIDDAAIKARFRESLIGFIEERKGLTAAEVRRELKREKSMEPGLSVENEPAEAVNYTAPELYQQAKEASLIIGHLYLCDSCDEWHTNLAGGVAISPEGLVLTNFHVLQFEKAAIFGVMNSKGEVSRISKVIASSRSDDLAIIQLDSNEQASFAPLASGIMIGEEVALVSHPDSHFYSFTTGRVSRLSIEPKLRTRRVEITAPFARGSSGSGIFNRRGQLLGLASATNAVYYEEDQRGERNLQRVIYSGVPLPSIRDLLNLTNGN